MYITTLHLKETDKLLEEPDGTEKMPSEELNEDENGDDVVNDEYGDEEKEVESEEEDSQDLDTSETYSIGGKTSYAAFMDRLDDVCHFFVVITIILKLYLLIKDLPQISFKNIFLARRCRYR